MHRCDLTAISTRNDKVNIFNLGTEAYCEVNDSIGWITEHLGLSPQIEYTGGERGWIGDNPFIYLDTKRIRALGWLPQLTIRDGIVRTLDWLRANECWVFERRSDEAVDACLRFRTLASGMRHSSVPCARRALRRRT